MRHRRAFITGGASGLGLALARRLARDGWRICLGDIDNAAGQAAAAQLSSLGSAAHYLHCNVTVEADLDHASRWLESQWGGCDLVVNNAGVAQSGTLVDTREADWQWIVNINLLGVVRGCRAFIPLLRRQGGGTILNVASMAGLVHFPGASAYNATKAAVVALSETLELELAPDHIRVCVACPSFFRSELARGMRASDEQSAQLTRRLVERARVSSDDVADAIATALQRGTTHIVTHPEARRAWRMKRWLPHRLWVRMLTRQVRQLNARLLRRAVQP